VLDRAASSLTIDDDNPVTLSVVDYVVSGTAPCNAYRGEIAIGEDDSVEISGVALTRRDCGPTTTQAEDEVVAALEAVDTAGLDEDDNERLTLHNDHVRLVFRPYDADQVLAGTWNIVTFTSGGTTASVLTGTEPTLALTDDGDVTLETGCNTGTSTWELDGHALSIDPVRISAESCDRPESVMVDQEAALVDILETADRVEIAPDELIILDADRTITLVADKR
jgi:heat shock protein HslJ